MIYLTPEVLAAWCPEGEYTDTELCQIPWLGGDHNLEWQYMEEFGVEDPDDSSKTKNNRYLAAYCMSSSEMLDYSRFDEDV